jgi:hypothetical protein
MENATHSPLLTASVEIKDSPKRSIIITTAAQILISVVLIDNLMFNKESILVDSLFVFISFLSSDSALHDV